jgi:hypothetical protein
MNIGTAIRAPLIRLRIDFVGRPIEAADPLSSGSTGRKAGGVAFQRASRGRHRKEKGRGLQ